MSKPETPKLVTALFTFKGTNNDELCFRKGDVITITQIDDEGWWEGTLNDKTGWFPSNYVKECRTPDGGHSSVKSSPEKSSQESPVHQRLNRDIVLKDFVDSERANVAELQGLVNNFLQPLELTNVLKKEEYKQLIGNFHEVVEVHQRLLANLEATVLQGADARVGNLFLTLAPRLKTVHLQYCNGHPQAVCIMDQYRDELNDFMERSGAVTPGILVLTTGLSKPFRRLEKYAPMLQELERHTEKNHFDRGDTQRSVYVYREIAEKCNYTRKQRELALQVLTSGIKGWEGEELNSLGEILHVGPVIIAVGAERRDRYFVLFPMTLLVLSTSSRMSSFVYEGKLPLTGIDTLPLDDNDDLKNAFEISGPFIETITVLCINREDRQQWIDLLSQDQSTSGLLRSPTMSHVSCSSHPYSRLSRFYARLVRKKVIYPELVKKLLYLQYVFKPDLSAVKMRKCTVTYQIFPKIVDSSDDEESSRIQIPEVKQRVKLKSSLLLDVRYATDDIATHSAHLPLTNPLKKTTSEESLRPLTFGNCQSLPRNLRTTSHVTNLHHMPSRNVVLAAIPFSKAKNNDESDDESEDTSADGKNSPRPWNSLASTSSEFIYLGNTPNHLAPISENEASSSNLLPVTSVHSSDSGMAESCHVTSSEMNSCYRFYGRKKGPGRVSHSESENDENKFEHQCICSSPFGSERESGCSKDVNSSLMICREEEGVRYFDEDDEEEDFRLLNVKLTINDGTSRIFDENNEEDEQCQVIDRKTEGEGRKGDYEKRFTEPIPLDHQKIKMKSQKIPRRPKAIVADEGQPVFTSGLYAHWWLKKTIPIDESTEQGKLHMTSNQSNGKLHHHLQECCSSPETKFKWSLASLRPAPPIYSTKTYSKTDNNDPCRSPRTTNERQFEDDAIILKVIEGYCITVNARFTMHPEYLDDTTNKPRDTLSIVNSRSFDDRTMPEAFETLKSQVSDLQTQMLQLTRQLEEEKQSRLLLAAAIKRRVPGIESLAL